MTATLKPETLRAWPPGGWQWVEPRVGKDIIPHPLAVTFDQAVARIVEFRAANPRLGLSTDTGAVRRELIAYTCSRLNNDPKFVIMVDEPAGAPGEIVAVKKKAEPYLPFVWVERVAEAAAGADLDVAREWLGDGGKPVAGELSAARAATCATCPGNQGGDWRRWFTKPAAFLVRRALEFKNAHSYGTPDDGRLGVCRFCRCELRLKVHVPLAVIRENETPEVLAKLDPRCWINKEASNA